MKTYMVFLEKGGREFFMEPKVFWDKSENDLDFSSKIDTGFIKINIHLFLFFPVYVSQVLKSSQSKLW